MVRTLGSVFAIAAAALMLAAESVHAQDEDGAATRGVLELHGIDDSYWDRLQDGKPIDSRDEETLIRILQCLPRLPKEKLELWSRHPPASWERVAADPAGHRGHVRNLRGRVTRIDSSSLTPEMAARLDFQSYYCVTIETTGSSQSAVVYTRVLPQSWESKSAIGESVGAVGVFLKSGVVVDDTRQLVFVADRLSWFPQKPRVALGISSAHVYLASLGFDVGLLDDARAQNKQPLSLPDRECFYSLLAAVKKSHAGSFAANAQQPVEIVSLLRNPQHHHGELMLIEGIARRVIRVRVDDVDIRSRFGLDHYFQVDVFVDLGKQLIKPETGAGEGRGESPTFANSYPITICVPSLPANLPEGEILRENIRVQGAFVKLWSYPSDYVSSLGTQWRQVSPLFIGVQPQTVTLPVMNPGFGVILATIVLVALLAGWIGLKREGKSPIRSALGNSTSIHAVEDRLDPLPDRPDFSRLHSPRPPAESDSEEQ